MRKLKRTLLLLLVVGLMPSHVLAINCNIPVKSTDYAVGDYVQNGTETRILTSYLSFSRCGANGSTDFWSGAVFFDVGGSAGCPINGGVQSHDYTRYDSIAAPSCPIPSCSDGIKNGEEEGVDCGCACSNLCPDSDPLPLPSDPYWKLDFGEIKCFRTIFGACGGSDEEQPDHVCCNNPETTGAPPPGVCEPPECFDNIKNLDETGVDCGGSCSAPCLDKCEEAPPGCTVNILTSIALVGEGLQNVCSYTCPPLNDGYCPDGYKLTSTGQQSAELIDGQWIYSSSDGSTICSKISEPYDGSAESENVSAETPKYSFDETTNPQTRTSTEVTTTTNPDGTTTETRKTTTVNPDGSVTVETEKINKDGSGNEIGRESSTVGTGSGSGTDIKNAINGLGDSIKSGLSGIGGSLDAIKNALTGNVPTVNPPGVETEWESLIPEKKELSLLGDYALNHPLKTMVDGWMTSLQISVDSPLCSMSATIFNKDVVLSLCDWDWVFALMGTILAFVSNLYLVREFILGGK